MMRKLKVTSGLYRRIHLSSSRWTQSQTVHAGRRIISCSDEVHRRYQNNTYITWRIVGNTGWRLLELGWRKRIVTRCAGFTRFILLNERPPNGYTGSGGRLSRKQTTTCLDTVWPDMWKHMSDAAKKKAKQRWAVEKPKLENARQFRGIFFIEPKDEENKLTVKAARRKLEVPMPAAMPCKIPRMSSQETHRNIGTRKTRNACVVDADESTRPRLEGAGHQPHQDHITAKGINSITHCSLVYKFIPMPQAFKIPDAKAAVEK